MRKLLMKLKRDERGVSALEYAVLAAILLVLIVAGIQLLDPMALFQAAQDSITEATTAAQEAAAGT